MSDTTNIGYCDHTWSPWQGCEPVSLGCGRCYMRSLRKRWGKDPSERVLTKDWKAPLRWNKFYICNHCGATEPVGSDDCRKCSDSTLRHRRVLVSMCDPFDPEVPENWTVNFWRLVEETPNLIWLILTKRIEEFKWKYYDAWPLKNVWLGVSAEDQQRADERIPILLSIPAKVWFLSLEPLLAPIDLRLTYAVGVTQNANTIRGDEISWVIVGGESGPRHRPMKIEWLRSIVDQCKAAGVPCYVKQASHRLPGQQGNIPDEIWNRKEFPNQ